jgi:hypothetical protein
VLTLKNISTSRELPIDLKTYCNSPALKISEGGRNVRAAVNFFVASLCDRSGNFLLQVISSFSIEIETQNLFAPQLCASSPCAKLRLGAVRVNHRFSARIIPTLSLRRFRSANGTNDAVLVSRRGRSFDREVLPMRAFVWQGLALCALCMPMAHGSVGAATQSLSVANEPALERSGEGATLEPTPDSAFDASVAGASPSSSVLGCGDASTCVAVRETARLSLGHRIALAARATEAAGDNSHSEAMTALDLVLMVLFAVGLIGYQLDRKQRVLRHSALFAAPP